MSTQVKIALLFLLFSFSFPDSEPLRKNQAFTQGEELTFRVKYLFFNAAEAKMTIHDNIHYIQNKPAFKIDVIGRTSSIFRLFYVKDNWGTYLDTANMIPYRSYRHIEEGNYRKHEVIDFDHEKNEALLKLYDNDNQKIVDTQSFKVPTNIQDIVSGYYLLRTMDFSRLREGRAITIRGFFDKKIYNLKLIYEGKQLLKTRIGTYETRIFSPVMPSNKLFSGDHPIKVWITDDDNRIPVRIKAELVVGALDMEITEAVGLRNP